MGKKKANVSILFADVAGSTRLYDTLGDTVAREIVSTCIDEMTEQTVRHGGTLIKTIGDEIMSTFPDAESAVTAACSMQEVITDSNEGKPADYPRIAIRVGLHFGAVIMEGNDVFGDAVNVAARMTGLAKADQIITTKSTVDLLSPMLKASTRFTDRAPVKGKAQEIDIYEIIWLQEDVTRMATDVIPAAAPPAKLRLTYENIDMLLDAARQSSVMGRGATCDITVNDTMASRNHVRIELRRGKFYVIDQSTNGTYVRMENEEDTFLRREELLIKGDGMLSLGRTFDETDTSIVHFKSET